MLARRLLRDDPAVRRWEQTDDVLQNALLRLHRAVKATKPATTRDFINLAATRIRRELKDKFRHHYGPEGHAAHHKSDPGGNDSARPPLHEAQADSTAGPQTSARMKEIHEQVEQLPVEVREVFDLIFYLGLEQAEVARRLGVSVPTVKRRYREARLLLYDALGGDGGLI
ncbi:MAG: polymerase, sigma-24 subunit, subfamily [Gemmataceae bacterium]|nr:polymerase, sigma-24 subunit, subfamily [Gemmataceae bacterium]